jgi:hypothetical protein
MKIIPVRQAGVLNFLGRQKMVTVPIRWKSGEGDKHPETELAYITKPEKEKLIKLDMHGSMKDGKPNFGPAGLISLNSGGCWLMAVVAEVEMVAQMVVDLVMIVDQVHQVLKWIRFY